MSPPLSLSVYPPNNYNGLFVVEPTYYTGLSKSRKDSTAFIYLETVMATCQESKVQGTWKRWCPHFPQPRRNGGSTVMEASSLWGWTMHAPDIFIYCPLKRKNEFVDANFLPSAKIKRSECNITSGFFSSVVDVTN